MSVALEQLAGAVERLLRLRESAAAFCTSGVCSIGGRCCGSVRAVLRQRARERRLLLVEVVLRLLAIELDQRPGPAFTRSPRSARMRLTVPSASDEIVT